MERIYLRGELWELRGIQEGEKEGGHEGDFRGKGEGCV
jgi:hypothetical protein